MVGWFCFYFYTTCFDLDQSSIRVTIESSRRLPFSVNSVSWDEVLLSGYYFLWFCWLENHFLWPSMVHDVEWGEWWQVGLSTACLELQIELRSFIFHNIVILACLLSLLSKCLCCWRKRSVSIEQRAHDTGVHFTPLCDHCYQSNRWYYAHIGRIFEIYVSFNC